MKGILLNSTTLAGKNYAYNDINKGITPSNFKVDKFYGGRVTRFGKTESGLLLCLEKNLEDVIDVFIDFDNLNKMSAPMLREIAEKVKERKILNTSQKDRDAMEKKLEIPEEATKKELTSYIVGYAIDIIAE